MDSVVSVEDLEAEEVRAVRGRMGTMRFVVFLTLLLSTPYAFAAEPLSTVTVTSSAPENGRIPLGAQRVDALDLSMHVPCTLSHDVSLQEITVRHIGLGDASDIEGVALYQGNRRLTRSLRFSSTKPEVTLRVRSLVLAPCTTTSFSLRLNFSKDAAIASEHGLKIFQDGIKLSGAAVSYNETTVGMPAQTVSATLPNVTVTALPLNRFPVYGDNRLLARFLMHGDTQKDAALLSMSLLNKGKATNKDIQNIRLQWNDGEIISETLPTMDEDVLRFTFTPHVTIDRSAQRILEVYGDVTASRKRTIDLVLEENSDLVTDQVRSR